MLMDCDDGLEFWVNFYSLSHFYNKLVLILSAQLNSDIMDFLNKAYYISRHHTKTSAYESF